MEMTVAVSLREIIEDAGVEIGFVHPVAGVVYIVTGMPFDGPYSLAYKIGYTNNLGGRIAQLQSEYRCELWVCHAVWSDDPQFVESCLHELFRDKWAKTPKGIEWYDLTHEDIDWLQTFEAISASTIKRHQKNPGALSEWLAEFGPNDGRQWKRAIGPIEM